MKRALITTAATVAVLASTTGIADAKSIGGCPRAGGFTLVKVADTGIPPEAASGIASLDGNGDGWTCTRTIAPGSILFRDNTVRG